MSLESYVTGLMKEESPKGMDRLVLGLLEKLESLYLSQAEKKRKKAWPRRSPSPCRW